MTRRVIVTLSALGCMLLAPLGISAQQLDLKAPPPGQGARPRSPEGDRYQHRPSVPYAPGFLAPLSKETEGGRAGVAGWTAPNTPVASRGASDPDNAGWLGFGFAVEWGGTAKSRRTN